MTSLFSNAPLNDSSKNTIIKFNEKEDDKLIRADDMLALVGADQSLSRDLSGSSFSMLLSEELSQGELLRAMSTLQDDLFRSTPPPPPSWLEHSSGPPRGLYFSSSSSMPGGPAYSMQDGMTSSTAKPDVLECAIGDSAAVPPSGPAAAASETSMRSSCLPLMPHHAEPRMQGSSPPPSLDVS